MKLYLTLMLAFLTWNTHAQISIKGNLTDSYGLPLLGVDIFLKRKPDIKTSSNKDGIYTLHLHKLMPDDSLVFSLMGYDTRTVHAQKFYELNDKKIILNKGHYILKELVTYSTPKDINKLVSSAYKKIVVNYTPSDYDCFYREYMSQNKKWVRFLESNLLVSDYTLTPPKDRDNFTLFLNHIRKSDDLLENRNHVSNPYHLLSQIFIFNPKKYNYTLVKTIHNETSPVYEIDFSPKENSGNFNGKLFIDSKSKAFLKIIININENYAQKRRVGKMKIDGHLKTYYFYYTKWSKTISFRKHNGSYQFNNIISHIKSSVYLKESSSPLYTFNTFEEAHFSPINLPVKGSPIDKKQDLFSLNSKLDSTFWKTYNYPIKDSLQKEVIRKIYKSKINPK